MSTEKQALIVWTIIFGIIGLFLLIKYNKEIKKN